MNTKVRLYKGSGFISSLIKFQTRSEYSHACFVIDDFIYEAKEFIGVRKIKDDKSGNYDEFSLDITKEQKKVLLEFLMAQLGKGYDYTMVARFITRQQEQRASSGVWFCSELVTAGLNKIKLPPLLRINPWAVSPALLALSLILK